MRVMIDGCDGTGKTSVCEKLANMLGCNIVRLTHGGDRNFKAYSEAIIPDNMVHDRTFLSEIIYPKYFGRAPRLMNCSIPALYSLLEQYEAKVFILTADNNEIRKRLIKRGDEFISNLEHVKGINHDYVQTALMNEYTVIDTTNKSIDDVVKEIYQEVMKDVRR
jgi:broad-specificity NMP kinase